MQSGEIIETAESKRTIISHNNVYGSPIVSFDDYIYQHSIKENKIWDEDVIDEIMKHWKDDTDLLDIGANIGLVTLGLLLKAQQRNISYHQIHCFECDPFTFSLLATNLSIYPFVKLYPFAVGEKQQLCNSFQNSYNHGCNYIYRTIDEQQDTHYDYTSFRHRSMYEKEVSSIYLLSVPLDSMLYQFKKRISVLKIDIEGFELQALRGAKDLIRLHRPVIVVEIWKVNFEPVIQFLAELCYSTYYKITNPSYNNEDYVFLPDPPTI